MLSALFGGGDAQDETRGTINWPWFPNPAPTWAGVSVTRESSLQLVTVYGCVRMISDSISTMPLDVFRRTPDGNIEANRPAWLDRPTVDLDLSEWCGQVLMSLLLEGNAYVAVTRSESGQIVELVPLDPAAVNVRRVGSRKLFIVNGVEQPSAEIVHIKGLMLPGSDVGLSPIEYARQSIGLGLSTLEFGAKFFDGEGNMPGVIELPHPAQPATMQNLAEQWKRKRSRAGKGLPGILESGATWKATGVTNEQAQFLATRKYTAAEIAGQMFMLDPTDLGIGVDGTSVTYANLEQRNSRRVQITLLPWIIRLEKALSGLLAQPRFVKFNVSGLLRGDIKTRWDTYYLAELINQSAAKRGDVPVLSTQEMREFEDFGPAPEQPNPPTDMQQGTDEGGAGAPIDAPGGAPNA